MIDNYAAKKENGLISHKTLDNGSTEIIESKYNELTGKKEVRTTYTTNASHMQDLINESDTQVQVAQERNASLKDIQADLGLAPKEAAAESHK